MHRLLVEDKRWVSENRFLHALNYCMLLPGPEAQQLATYLGWLLHGTRGGLIAGTLFILPGFLAILLLSIVYAVYQEATLVAALFFGLKAAVLAVVVEAVIRIGRRALKNWAMVTLAAVAFTAIFFFAVPFPFIVAAAGLVGYLGGKVAPQLFYVITGHAAKRRDEAGFVITDEVAARLRPSTKRAVQTLATWLALWFAPLLAIIIWDGTGSVFVQVGTFFSTAAVVTFGGAYAVLAYVAQQAVETYGWLSPGEMLHGLAMAETTPGPLIQVVQFVGFMGAYRFAEGLSPMLAGVLGAILTTWVTFVPSFLWIFLGAPYIEYLRGNQGLTAALSGITAAVVGVILNLAVWFALHVIFGQVNEVHAYGLRLFVPTVATLDTAALIIAAGAFMAIFLFRLGMIPTLFTSAVVGLVYYLLARG